jgi:hypothetical protein
MEKFLYRTYLVSHDPLLVFQGEAPKGLWNREQILESRKNRIRRRLRRMTQTVIPSESLWANLDKVRKHLFYYRYDPLGFPSAFGMMRYILLELSKRHHHSLILKEVLRSRYDIDLTQLRDVLESESEVSSPG